VFVIICPLSFQRLGSITIVINRFNRKSHFVISFVRILFTYLELNLSFLEISPNTLPLLKYRVNLAITIDFNS
jgi:hypothetical protein